MAGSAEGSGAWWRPRRIRPAELAADGNAFTALRWLLASLVMVSHAWDITMPVRGIDPTVAWLGFPISRLAVFLFFSLSGFLVTGSLFKRSVADFLKARALRLLPGLWVMLLVIPLLFGAAFATADFTTFMTHHRTIDFVWRNALLLGKAFLLPFLFVDHPLGGSINGSLWTIPHEVRCYLALAVLALLGLTRSPRSFLALVLAALVVLPLLPVMAEPFESARRLGFSFALGVLAWLVRERLPLSWPLALVAAGAALALPFDLPGRLQCLQVSFFYLLLVAAFAVPPALKTASQRLPDYSYGIYIYAFPMQQAAYALGAWNPYANLALGFALTVPMAALSWHLVEKPAMALKGGKIRPLPAG